MKTLKFFSTLLLLFAFLLFTKCSEDETVVTPLSTLSGKVTFTNASGVAANASGAIVSLEDVTASTTVSTVADNLGDFRFDNLAAGSYNLSGSYYSENKNVAGRLDGLTFATATDVTVEIVSADVSQNLTLVSVGQSGAAFEALSAAYSWTGSAYANTGAWIFDNVHSSVVFEFAYRGNEADFTGSFGQTSKFNVSVDPANLAAASIDVEIDLASINTRTPGGRDNRTTVADNPPFNPLTMFTELGCIAGTFGITADNATPSEGTPQPITLNAKRYAKFTSTSVSKYGDGYVAKGNLVFNGVTKATELWFKMVPAWTDPSNNRKYSGFEGKLLMKAKADFAITSSNINDAVVKIFISTVLYKQL